MGHLQMKKECCFKIGETVELYIRAYTRESLYGALAYYWKLFQDGLVFLIAVHISPVGVVEMGVEFPEDFLFLASGNCHVVFDRVQSPQHQVEDAYGRPEITRKK